MRFAHGAFHWPLVARAADRLKPAIDKGGCQEPVSPFMSTVTARASRRRSAMATLLVEQLTAPVRFTQAVRELIARRRAGMFVEIGPGKVLSGIVQAH